MTLVDSSVWIDYFRGIGTPEVERLDHLLEIEAIAIGDVNLTEVLQGFQSDQDFDQARGLLMSLIVVEIVGIEVAILAAKNFRELRARGITVRKTIDTLIAARCILDDVPLLFSERDFDPFVHHLGLQSAMPTE